jgi:2-desacetyl-2-hydroxyethyl bacteriochlorophyllide A dehydrogenase
VSADARAFWVAEPGRGEIRDEVLPPVSGNEVVVRALFSGISRGTEALVFKGRVPISERDRMRAPFQSGDFPAPIKYGYASVGRVERGPREVEGRNVFVLYPHQTRYVVPAESLYVLPDDVPPNRAILAANLETAINGVWDARPHIGDRIAVIGAGTVGCLVAWLASRIAACEVQLIDANPQRRAVATTLGASFAAPEQAAGDADVVVHASGSAAGLDLALRLAAFEAHVVEMSWYGADTVPIALGHAFHSKRLSLISSQVGRVAASQRARWDHRRRMELAVSMLAEPALDALITGESEFDRLPSVMTQLAEAPGETICHRIRYSSA